MKRLKSVALYVLTLVFIYGTVFYSRAAVNGWISDEQGMYYLFEDASRPVSEWRWIDDDGDRLAECYYFDDNGYLFTECLTPDGYNVNEVGMWIVNGIVQTQVRFPYTHGTIEHINISGLDQFSSEAEINALKNTIYQIPGEILEYHRLLGGDVAVYDSEHPVVKSFPDQCTGAYGSKSHDIWVLKNDHTHFTVSHELGHFVYFRTLPYWTDENLVTLQQLVLQYSGIKTWGYMFRNVEEAFAVLYACSKNDSCELSNETKRIISAAEDLCIKRYNDEFGNLNRDFK